MADYSPPVAFSFSVEIIGEPGGAGFSEVSGLNAEIDVAESVEGGENRFIHQLPKPAKHQNLILKRGIAAHDAPLIAWCSTILDADLTQRIKPKKLRVVLRDEHQQPLMYWDLTDAYPVKWDVGDFAARENQIAIEQIEFAYASLSRGMGKIA